MSPQPGDGFRSLRAADGQQNGAVLVRRDHARNPGRRHVARVDLDRGRDVVDTTDRPGHGAGDSGRSRAVPPHHAIAEFVHGRAHVIGDHGRRSEQVDSAAGRQGALQLGRGGGRQRCLRSQQGGRVRRVGQWCGRKTVGHRRRLADEHHRLGLAVRECRL